MRIKLSELKSIVKTVILEYQPAQQGVAAYGTADERAENNLQFKLKDLAKSLFRIAKNFKAHRGNPNTELMAAALDAKNELQALMSGLKNKPEYVYLKALDTDFAPLAQASGKFGKPAFLGKEKYATNNVAAAEQLIKQLQRFKKEVLDKHAATSDLVGYEKE